MIKQAENSTIERPHIDVHGTVGIELVDATAADCELVSHALGLTISHAAAEADLRLRFADQVGGATERLIGRDDVAFTDDHFVVIRSGHRARVQLPFDRIGGPCELLYQRGGSSLPLLLPTINVTMMDRGMLPIHASAFRFQGQGALVTGWAHGGKTTALLGFMSNGADFISDDWTYAHLGRGQMHGLPKPLELSDRQLAELPLYRARLARGQRWQMRSARLAEQVIQRAAGQAWSRNVMPRAVTKHLLPAIQRRRSVEVSPRHLFGGPASAPEVGRCPVNAIFFAMSHTSSNIEVAPASADELVERMALMLEHEYAGLRAAYRKFRFAFPDRRNNLMDHLDVKLRAQLADLLAATPAYLVYHPNPVSAEAMFEALRRWL